MPILFLDDLVKFSKKEFILFNFTKTILFTSLLFYLIDLEAAIRFGFIGLTISSLAASKYIKKEIKPFYIILVLTASLYGVRQLFIEIQAL